MRVCRPHRAAPSWPRAGFCWRASSTFRCFMYCWSWTARFPSFKVGVALALIALSACSRGRRLPALGAVPEFKLTDQTGSEFTSTASLAGRVWVADFFFTNCPGPCPRMSSQMHQVQTALAGKDVKLVSMTVDPDRDTPEKLAKYAAFYSATPGVWYFLTGPRETLDHLGND